MNAAMMVPAVRIKNLPIVFLIIQLRIGSIGVLHTAKIAVMCVCAALLFICT